MEQKIGWDCLDRQNSTYQHILDYVQARGNDVTLGNQKLLTEQAIEDLDLAALCASALHDAALGNNATFASPCVEKIKDIYQHFYADEKIALIYMQSLLNLVYSQEEANVCFDQTVERMAVLYKAHKENADFAEQYAYALFLRSLHQKIGQQEATLAELLELQTCFPDCQDIAELCLQGFYNLAYAQELVKAEKTIMHMLQGATEWAGIPSLNEIRTESLGLLREKQRHRKAAKGKWRIKKNA